MRRQLIEEARAGYFSWTPLGEGHRKKMSLSISDPLAQAARQRDINLSRAETVILQEIKRCRDSAWLEKNRPAIAASNERLEREGLFGEDRRNF